MPDISKCLDAEDCPFKWFCYRFTAPENEHWQSYSHMKDFSKSGKTCHNQLKSKCPFCGQTKVHKPGCATNKKIIVKL